MDPYEYTTEPQAGRVEIVIDGSGRGLKLTFFPKIYRKAPIVVASPTIFDYKKHLTVQAMAMDHKTFLIDVVGEANTRVTINWMALPETPRYKTME